MKLNRLYLRNYRVYEDPLELELPAGLVGVYGANGAGKSALLESLLWTLWGVARTAKDEVRTSGARGDCITEAEFEHEDHLYLVRRTLTGINATVRAEVHADHAQVAEGVKDTGRYLHSVLGMDDSAFRASVFAEQKQLAAFSLRRPAERQKLVLGLLGITPLDGARDQARKDSRQAHERLAQLRGLLADLEQLEAELALAQQAALEADGQEAASARASAQAAALLAEAEAEAERLDQVGRVWEQLCAEGQRRRREGDELAQRLAGLESDEQELAEAEAQLGRLTAEAGGLEEAETRLGLTEAVVRARAAYDAAGRGIPAQAPARPDPEAVAAVVEAAQGARAVLAGLEGRASAAAAERDRARAAVSKAGALSSGAECPLCGQALGSAFEEVRAHRQEELAAAESTLADLLTRRDGAARAAAVAADQAGSAQAGLVRAQSAWALYEQAVARRAEAEGALAEAEGILGAAEGVLGAGEGILGAGEGVLGAGVLAEAEGAAEGAVEGTAEGAGGRRAPDPEVLARLGREVARRRRAAQDAATLRGRLQRRTSLGVELARARQQMATLEADLAALRLQVQALDFHPEDLAAARRARLEARAAAAAAASVSQAAAVAGAQARARAAAAAQRLEDAAAQHLRVAAMEEDARHLGRTAELLGGFRNTVAGSVGPRLSRQASELFAELTDREYDELDIDPESFEIKLLDQGVVYGMDRFSGSETDLANLALRVAISDQVRFRSGGAVGLLVLDEIFGPLDEGRKERMLVALERLKGRFRQVLVVTHDADIKEQLPNAIEVVKLSGRRATARLL